VSGQAYWRLGVVQELPKLRKRVDEVRIPGVNGLPDDVYHVLRHSFVGIVQMLRSIEAVDVAITSSMRAIAESRALLKRT
jgi:hypothetical protein